MAKKTAGSAGKTTRVATTTRKPATRSRTKKNTNSDLSHEQISARAYEIYCERLHTGRPGNADEDWACAEAELKDAASSSV